jgi:hypothetical protein
MGLYGERVLPRIVNVACGTKSVAPLRRRVCDGLAGDVVEIGFGSGLNVAFYPAAVTRVAAVEPAEVSWELAGKRLRRSCGASSGPAGRCTSSSTVWPPTSGSAAGNDASSRCRSESSADAT